MKRCVGCGTQYLYLQVYDVKLFCYMLTNLSSDEFCKTLFFNQDERNWIQCRRRLDSFKATVALLKSHESSAEVTAALVWIILHKFTYLTFYRATKKGKQWF